MSRPNPNNPWLSWRFLPYPIDTSRPPPPAAGGAPPPPFYRDPSPNHPNLRNQPPPLFATFPTSLPPPPRPPPGSFPKLSGPVIEQPVVGPGMSYRPMPIHRHPTFAQCSNLFQNETSESSNIRLNYR